MVVFDLLRLLVWIKRVCVCVCVCVYVCVCTLGKRGGDRMDAVVVWFSTFQKTGERIQPWVARMKRERKRGELRAGRKGERETEREGTV